AGGAARRGCDAAVERRAAEPVAGGGDQRVRARPAEAGGDDLDERGGPAGVRVAERLPGGGAGGAPGRLLPGVRAGGGRGCAGGCERDPDALPTERAADLRRVR